MPQMILPSGKLIDPLSPDSDVVTIEDIARTLSNRCRWGSRCPVFYSVAQHSVMVSRLLPYDLAMTGLLHDAGEAYITDFPAPVKHRWFVVNDNDVVRADVLEMVWIRAIGSAFSVKIQSHFFHVKNADAIALATEARDLYGVTAAYVGGLDVEPAPEKIVPLSPDEAYAEFMARYEELKGGE